jgi:hypothetical protein
MAMFHPFQDGGELAWDSLVQAKAEHLRELVSGEAEQSEVAALQAAADRLSPQVIRKQLDHWTWVVGPKFSQKDRAAIILGHLPLLTRPENIVHFFRDIRYGQNSGIPRPAGCQTALQRSPSVPSFDSCLENKIIRQRTDGDQNFKYVWLVIATR